MRKIAMVGMGMVGLLIASFAAAQDHPEHPTKPAETSVEAEVLEATVTGENICLGCTLKKEQGAAAQCSTYGHRHALRVTGGTAGGEDVPELEGWILHYLETDQAQPFIREHHAETLVLTGTIYTSARVFEVDTQEEAKKPEHPEHPK